MRLPSQFCSVAFLAGAAACANAVDENEVVENAVFMEALVDESTEALTDVPTGDLDSAAEELADEIDTPDEEMQDKACSLGALRKRVVHAYDKDGDGKLSEGEMSTLKEDFGKRPRRMRRFARHHRWNRMKWVYDVDEDGTLSDEERQTMRNDLEQRCLARQAYLLENYDANGDGQLDEDEWKTIRDERRAKRQARKQELLDQFDTDGDGFIKGQERRALKQHWREKLQEKRNNFKDKYDVDDSGDLDAEEKAAAREAIRARIRGEFIGEN